MSSNSSLNNLILLIILSAIWGSAFISIKVSVEYINPISVASMRLIIAAIVLYIYFKSKNIVSSLSKKNIFLIFIIGLIGNFIPFTLISWSEIYLKSNTAGLLLSIAPIFALVFSHFMTKDDKFTILKLFSILIGFVGVLFIIGFDSFYNLNENKNLLIAKIAIIISALGYVLSSIFAYNLKEINSITLTTYVTISAAIISLPFLIYVEYNYSSNFNIKSVLPLIYLGVFPTAIAFLMRFYLIHKAGPIFLSYVAYLIPAFAIVWGYLFLNETVTFNSIIGVILVLLGVLISQKKLVTKKTNNSIYNQ